MKNFKRYFILLLVLFVFITTAGCSNTHSTHSYKASVVSPTCYEKGYTTYLCECGDIYDSNYVDKIAHIYIDGVYSECGAVEDAPVWKPGTIMAADGIEQKSSNRLCTDFISITDYEGVSVNLGYTLIAYAYDADKNYLGNSGWLGNGINFLVIPFWNAHENIEYFRLTIRAIDSSAITEQNFNLADVTFYAVGEDLPKKRTNFNNEILGHVGAWQEGAILDNKVFLFGAKGNGTVYDLTSMNKVCDIMLDNLEAIKPHGNSVCFGSTYYDKNDKYPLLYVNIYNNYADKEDRMEGTCCVYRLSEEADGFITKLVQVIRIGFIDDLTLWKSLPDKGDLRPFGNFVVDTDKNQLYAFVMRDLNKTTRFFRFDIPSLNEGTFNKDYSCNVVTLNKEDLKDTFDTEYFYSLQGCDYGGGKIFSVEGFNSGSTDEPALRIVDLNTKKLEKTYYPATAEITKEPEVVCVDPATGKLYFATTDGLLRVLNLPGQNIKPKK